MNGARFDELGAGTLLFIPEGRATAWVIPVRSMTLVAHIDEGGEEEVAPHLRVKNPDVLTGWSVGAEAPTVAYVALGVEQHLVLENLTSLARRYIGGAE